MQNLDDKHIFDKVRSTLEEYQPQCSPKDWNKMAALLDQQPRLVRPVVKSDWFKGFISGIIVSIVFIGSLYFVFDKKNSEPKHTSATIVVNSNIQEKNQPQITNFNNSKSIENTNRSRQINDVTTRVADVYNIDLSELKDDSANSDKQIANTDLSRNLSTVNNENATSNNYVVTFSKLAPKEFNADKYIKVKYERMETFYPKSKPAVKKVDRSDNKSKLITINWDIFKGFFKLQDDMYKRFIGPDKIKLGYSPEVVFGNFQSESGMSHGLGLALEGPISKHLSVGIGVDLRKYEWTKRKEFKTLQMEEFPDTAYHYVVDSTHQNVGRWQYLEVPISFSLHFMTFGKSKIFINTSIAAVIMQSEKYEFNRIIGQDKFSQPTEFKPFSNYNVFGDIKLGFEYRYALNRRWNLYFEPYYKWYIKGMGDTNFKPQGLGINFGLIYQFNMHE